MTLLISKQDAYNHQHRFASDEKPTLYKVLPAIEELLTAWEAKTRDPRYTIFVNALDAGVGKLRKYYSRFDLKPCILINLGTLSVIQSFSYSQIEVALHPYFKLDWIALNWGSVKEQEQERAKGNSNAKNWQDEARKVLEDLVCICSSRYINI